MTSISQDNKLVTLINVFTVAPEKQQELAEILMGATEQIMNTMTGFISANIHKSLDGTKVVNYAQWQTKADFEAMLQNAEVKPHMTKAAELATFDPIVCEVVYVDENKNGLDQ